MVAVRISAKPKVMWSRLASEIDSAGSHFEAVAVADGRIHVSLGPQLLALDEASGRLLWSAELKKVGGAAQMGRLNPMISSGLVVVSTKTRTAAFETSTGKLAWSVPAVGARVVYDGRVYVREKGRYHVFDLVDGRQRLAVPLASKLKKFAKGVSEPSTQLAVSDTHVFFGDMQGRVWAIERETGEPVWFDKPAGAFSFLGVIPVIAGGRLYISSIVLSRDRNHPPTYLYCYEEADGVTAASKKSATTKPEQKAKAVLQKAGSKRAAPMKSAKRPTSTSSKARKPGARPKSKKRG